MLFAAFVWLLYQLYPFLLGCLFVAVAGFLSMAAVGLPLLLLVELAKGIGWLFMRLWEWPALQRAESARVRAERNARSGEANS